ncbi:MAG: exonuclease VII large subunit [Bacteroidales bacterium]|nr:exonuclease VII large subunit [Bacteroidales bacterium]
MSDKIHDLLAPNSQVQIYNPSELLNIFSDILARQNTSSKVIYMRGVYHKQKFNPGWAAAYDILRDEHDQQELTMMMPLSLRDELKDGSLVVVGGTLTRKVSAKGYIQLVFQVSRVDVVKDQVISEDDMRRSELRTQKSQSGYRNVDALLEEILFRGEKPKVALIFASTSITMADFDAGKDAAATNIDFYEHRVSFAKSEDLVSKLKDLDSEENYDVLALVRGGGGGIEALDDLNVLECVVGLNTPLICAVGHVDEKIFIKNLADKVAPTPNGLGTYFSNMVETVIQKRNNSRAALVEEVKKQYIRQIETAEKQNKTLQEQVEKMTKASAEAQANFKAQSEALTKQLATLQENLKGLQKTNEDQAKKFNDTIAEMQKTNSSLQESISKLTLQNAQSQTELTIAKKLSSDLESSLSSAKSNTIKGVVITAIVVIVAMSILFLI